MNGKLRVTLKVFENVSINYSVKKKCIENKIKEVCEREHITVEEVIRFVVFCLRPKFACF